MALTLDLALHVGGLDEDGGWALSPLLGAGARLGTRFWLEGLWGMTYAERVPAGADDREGAFRSGNPYAAVYYARRAANGIAYRVGLGATVPVATLPDEINDQVNAQTAYVLAAAMRGNWNYWLWDANAFSLVLPFRVGRERPSGWRWGAEVAAAFMIPTNKDKNDAFDYVVQMAFDFGYDVATWFRAGARLHLVLIPNLDAQQTQSALEPFARFGNDRAFGSLRLMVNLDESYGFAFDKGKIWALRFGGGVAF